MTQLEQVLSKLDENLDEDLERLFGLLKIPSVSTDPSYHKDCVAAAEYCAKLLNDIGFQASAIETEGKPMVLAHYTPEQDTPEQESSAPHVLFYGHYDVQPEDPVELWDSPPFSPQIKDDPKHGKIIVARGASDDKGQLMTFIEACKAWKSVHGTLPLKTTILLEGEEESGSPSLMPFLEKYREQLKADVVLICDTGQLDADTPAITTMLRGLAFTEITVTGPNRDLHSGHYGGVAINPIRVLTKILGDLYDENGVIQIPHFYDDVAQPSQKQLEQWKQIEGHDFLTDIGLSVYAGEKAHSPIEQNWSRPSLDINGIYGGYMGPGTKTVIPSIATAKVTFRLVANQDPNSIIENFENFVKERLPKDCQVSFKDSGGTSAVKFDQDSKYMRAALQGLEDEFNKEALMIGCGASIPIVETFQAELGMDAILVGFALEDDSIHSPNEKYNVSSFAHGRRAWARIMQRLSEG